MRVKQLEQARIQIEDLPRPGSSVIVMERRVVNAKSKTVEGKEDLHIRYCVPEKFRDAFKEPKIYQVVGLANTGGGHLQSLKILLDHVSPYTGKCVRIALPLVYFLNGNMHLQAPEDRSAERKGAEPNEE